MPIVWLLLWSVSDAHSVGTLLAFSPRWPWLLLVGLLLPVAAWQRRWKSLGVLIGAGLIAAGPVMGFCVPWRAWKRAIGAGEQVRVASCNVQAGGADGRLHEFLNREKPSVVALQEWPSERPWPAEMTGWHVAREGQLLVASRWPLVRLSAIASPVESWRTAGLACRVERPAGDFTFVCLHLMTPRPGLEAVLHEGWSGLAELQAVTDRRELESAAVAAWLDQQPRPLVVAGDLNMPVESVIYRREFGWMQNAFTTAGLGYGYTKYTRWHGIRIDHILADRAWSVSRSSVGPYVGSDHRPQLAELVQKP